ncbi:MAG: MFS transporter [Magnetovibrio sp.]|nr:MFS transporter [Magnetovibrio sp.]
MSSQNSFILEKRIILLYSFPAFVIALPIIPVYVVLPTLYGVQLGLGLASTGLILLSVRLFDTISDPVIGFLSDVSGYKGIRRKPWICIGSVIAGIGLFKILNPPAVVNNSYLLGWSLMLYTGWTMVAVPYTAWGAELSRDYHLRTKITSWREGIGLFGILAAGLLNAGTAQLNFSTLDSMSTLSWFALLLGPPVIIILIRYVPDQKIRHYLPEKAVSKNFLKQIRILFSNRLFLRLLLAWFLNGLANGIPAALFFLYLEHGLGVDESKRPLFILLYFLSAVVTIPIWSSLSFHFGKHRAWCYAMLLASLAFLTVPLVPVGGFLSFAIICMITGAALGADLTIPPAVQGDVVDYELYRTGEGRAGMQFALWGVSTKLALALAIGVALPGLEFLDFDPLDVTEGGRNILIIVYSQIPVVFKVIAVLIVWNFPLNLRRQQILRQKLRRNGYC